MAIGGKIKKYGLIALLVLALLAGGSFYYYKDVAIGVKKEKEQAMRDEAYKLYRQGDPLSAEKLKQVLSIATDFKDKAYLSASLSLQEIKDSNSQVQAQAIKRVQDIIADSGIKPGLKAGMINLLVDLAIIKQDAAFLKERFFQEAPYDKFLADAQSQIFPALILVEEWSVENFPTSQAHLRLAEWYGSLAVRAQDDKKSEYISKAKRNLQQGEALLERDSSVNTPERQIGLHMFRASTHGILVLLGEEELKKAEELFRDAISRAEIVARDNVYLQGIGLNARLRYAMLLAAGKKDGDIGADANIQDILKPFGDVTLEQGQRLSHMQSLINNLKVMAETDSLASQKGYPGIGDYKKIAGISLEFNAFLKRFSIDLGSGL